MGLLFTCLLTNQGRALQVTLAFGMACAYPMGYKSKICMQVVTNLAMHRCAYIRALHIKDL